MADPQAHSERPDAASTEGLVGKTVGRFAIRTLLGKGGMGEVYRADDTRLNRPVALKRIAPALRADETYRRRFLKEAERASQFTDQHIAGIYDVFEEAGEIFLVMEYVEGRTLRDRLRRCPPDPPPSPAASPAGGKALGTDEFLNIATQCGEALVAAHSHGIIHCDIKPENIMLTAESRVKILDFGVARRAPVADRNTTVDSLTTLPGSSGGTPAYMAPEILLQKDFDARADIFSLGVVFYEALTGQHPFAAAGLMATCSRVLHETPTPLSQLNPTVAAGLEGIVARMLAKAPGERYGSAADLLADLRAVQREPAALVAAPLPAPAGKAGRLKRYASRIARIAAALAVAVALAVAIIPSARHRVTERFAARSAIPGQKHVAVLAFENVGGDPANRAFCDGLTYVLASKLTQLEQFQGSLFVVPAADVVKGGINTAEAARKQFGVNLVLTGSVQRTGDKVVLTASLVDAVTLRQLRALDLSAAIDDPLTLQNGLAVKVAGMLQVEPKPQLERLLGVGATGVARAHDFYLQGWGYFQNYDRPENVDRAIEFFQRALGLDPKYALAHAVLGQAYLQKYRTTSRNEWLNEALATCERATQLGPEVADGHTCLAMVYIQQGKYEQAEKELEQSRRLGQPSELAYRGLGKFYEGTNKLEEAERAYQRAINVRPNYWACYNWLGVFYFNHGRNAQAARMFEQVVALSPDNTVAYKNLGAVYLLDGHYEKSIKASEHSIAIQDNARARSNLAVAYFNLRRFGEAVEAQEAAVKLGRGDYSIWGNLGDIYCWAPGKREKAAEAYREALSLADKKLEVNARDGPLLASTGLYHAMLGHRTAALDRLQRAVALAPDDHMVRFKEARVYNQLGETNLALRALEKALAAGYSVADVHDTPIFDNLRTDPRFQGLIKGKWVPHPGRPTGTNSNEGGRMAGAQAQPEQQPVTVGEKACMVVKIAWDVSTRQAKVDVESCRLSKKAQHLLMWQSADGGAYNIRFRGRSPFLQRDFVVSHNGATTAGPAVGPPGTYPYEIGAGHFVAVADPDVLVDE
jgi:tetratricopeptide (TPR) repeat protein/tRNA A-37 threonylcarbamoyl transferase component Bud32